MMLEATAHNRAADAALRVYERVLSAVRGDQLVHEAMQRLGDELFVQRQRFDLSRYRRIVVCGVGKASVSMSGAALEVLAGAEIGVVVAKEPHSETGVPEVVIAGHPVPDENSLSAGEKVLSLASTMDERTLVVFLLSGGASSLMEVPVDGVSLDDLRTTNEFLLRSGQPIGVVNAVRSRISRLKAGGLAKAFAPATVLVLALSDVLGNDLSTVGSGPFLAPRPGSDISARFAYSEGLPMSVRAALQQARGIELGETADVHHFVIGSVSLAIHAAISAAEELGLEAFGYSNPMQGEARDMARKIARHAATVLEHRKSEPFCMIFGGETTVTLGSSPGKGGRCQEMALAIAPRLERMPECAFLAAGTDGTDGPTDAAGATADPDTVSRALANGWKVQDVLARHESYAYLSASDNLIFTGPTDSNVNDLALFISA